MKKYRLKKNVKILIITILLLSLTTLYLKMYQDRIERIENGEITLQYNGER